jgi:TetR/AcrR family transcriptional regulator
MQEVADEAGVNKALLHYYFRSKEGLAQAVFRRAFVALVPRVLDVLRSELPLEEKVERVVAIEIDALRASPFLPGYILGELTHHPERIHRMFESVAGPGLERMGEEVVEILGRQIEVAEGEGRMRAVTPEEFVMNTISLVIFPVAACPLLQVLFGLKQDEFDALMEQRKATLPEFILNGLRP